MTLEEVKKQLNEGYVLEFDYMDRKHHISSFDDQTYVILKYTNDNRHKRIERRIVDISVLDEMYKNMTNIVYVY